jgi:hypothetical protein
MTLFVLHLLTAEVNLSSIVNNSFSFDPLELEFVKNIPFGKKCFSLLCLFVCLTVSIIEKQRQHDAFQMSFSMFGCPCTSPRFSHDIRTNMVAKRAHCPAKKASTHKNKECIDPVVAITRQQEQQ